MSLLCVCCIKCVFHVVLHHQSSQGTVLETVHNESCTGALSFIHSLKDCRMVITPSTVLSTGDTKARKFIHANEEAEVNK